MDRIEQATSAPGELRNVGRPVPLYVIVNSSSDTADVAAEVERALAHCFSSVTVDPA